MFLLGLLFAASLTFPIPELGNCDSLSNCKTYCDVPWHRTVCTNFGIKQGWIKKPQVLAAVRISYPIPELGNCGSKAECKAFCDIPANRPACVDFARRHGIDTSVAASRGRAPAKRPGGGLAGLTFPIPELGNCASVRECKIYCDQPRNRQACFDFAYKKGLLGGKKAAEKLSGLKFPIAELGNCGSMAECKAYCEQPDHRKACAEYAKKMGFKPPRTGPGGCITPEECEAYCRNPAHREECEAARRKICARHPDWPECREGPPGRGPGGCTSEEECRAYCEANPDDPECQRGRKEYCREHPEECQGPPASKTGPPEGEGPPPGREFLGPGGCRSEEECRRYCQEHPNDPGCRRPPGGEGPPPRSEHEGPPPPAGEERPPGGGGPPEGGEGFYGPGGCTTEEECRAYCSSHPDDPACQGGPQP